MREEAGKGLSLATFKQLLREQFFTLLLDERRAVDAIPAMLDKDPDLSSRMTSNLRRMIDVVGVKSTIAKARLAEIENLFQSNNGHRPTLRVARQVGSRKAALVAEDDSPTEEQRR
jgi:hypothetical protein